MEAQPPSPPPPEQPDSAAHMRSHVPIHSPLLRAVYASDQDMYPVTLSYTRLRSWVDACPDLCICFQQEEDTPNRESDTSAPATAVDTAAGVVIVLPLKRKYWEDLLVGRLKEPEIDPWRMFAGTVSGFGSGVSQDGPGRESGKGGSRDVEEVGLHVYHIERFGREVKPGFTNGGGESGKKRFAEIALEEVMRRAQARTGWKVVGMSALTATQAGKRTFERLHFTPTGYREQFVTKVAAGTGAAQNSNPQVEMICLYPGDETVPEVADGAITVSMSEMTAMYWTPLSGYGA
ncbi:hypothetical protein VTI74DRAFT_3867 [Chaetomium olivicolor]